MSKVSQKNAVVEEVKSILGGNFDSSMPAKDQLTKDQFSLLKANVVQGIVDGNVSYNKEVSDIKEVEKYVSGMISNHFRKAKELNGNTTYTPSSGSSRDPQLVELQKLLKTYEEGTDEYNQIVSAVNSRKEEIAAEKANNKKAKQKEKKLKNLDVEALPDNLQGLASDLVDNT